MIEVELPDGSVAEFPDGMQPDQIKAAIQKRFAPQAPPVDTTTDMAKGFGTGVGQGAISMLGGFRDAADMTGDFMQWGAGKMGAPEWLQGAAGNAGRLLYGPMALMPSSQDITGAVESVTGPMYEAQTTPGEYAQTVGQFAPAALLGPGGMGRKLASGLLGAIASETAGQATEGSEVEPYARLGAGILGGAAGMIGSGKSAAAKVLKEAPTQEAVKSAADDAYTALRQAGIQYDDNAYRSFAMKLVNRLREAGWRPRNDDSITRDLNEVVQRVGKPNDFAELENLRQNIGSFSPNMTKREMAHAAIMREALDEFTSTGNMVSRAGMSQDEVNAMASQAREMARRNILARDMDEINRKSEWYLGGEESGKRNQAASYGKRNEKRLTKEESAALKKVVTREGLLNVANTAGSRLGLIAGMPSAAGLGMMVGGPAGAVVGAGASLLGQLGSRKIMEGVTNRAMEKAKKTILLGREGQKKLAKARKQGRLEVIPRAGLLTAPSIYQPSQSNGR